MTMFLLDADLSSANELLAGLGAVRVALVEYRRTHGYLHIELSYDGRCSIGNVFLVDCSEIRGPTEGGPWRVAVHRGDDGALSFASAGAELVVHARRGTIELPE